MIIEKSEVYHREDGSVKVQFKLRPGSAGKSVPDLIQEFIDFNFKDHVPDGPAFIDAAGGETAYVHLRPKNSIELMGDSCSK